MEVMDFNEDDRDDREVQVEGRGAGAAEEAEMSNN